MATTGKIKEELKVKEFPTSDRLYHRLMTDPKYNKNDFFIVYWDGLRNKYIDMPIVKWVAKDGDIPWHRVYYFKYHEQVIWDREAKTFILHSVPVMENTGLATEFTLFNLNTLCELYQPAITKISLRYAAMSKQILDTDADIVCLQEVTPALQDLINADSDLTAKYPVCIVSDLDPMGEMLLSKTQPVEFEDFELSRQKYAIRAMFQLEDGRLLDVFTCHLTSSVAVDAENKRLRQLKCLSSKINRDRLTVVALDSNSFDSRLPYLDYMTDAWLALQPDADGFTFDVQHNSLAQQMSRTQRSARYDRILSFSSSGDLRATNICVLNEVQVSDHYGLLTRFDANAGAAGPALAISTPECRQTALVLIPPVELWPHIQEMRVQHDPYFPRWMPHISVCFGFVAGSEFEAMSQRIAALGLQAFDANFCGYDILPQQRACTLFARLDEPSETQVLEMAKRLNLVYPCQMTKPHLSLGLVESEAKARAYTKQSLQWNFPVDRLYMISRENSVHFQVKRVIHLQKPNVAVSAGPASTELSDVSGANSGLVGRNPGATIQFLSHLAAPSAKWQPVGSHLFNGDTNGSDCDLLVWSPLAKTTFINDLHRQCEQCGEFTECTVLTNDHTASLRVWTLHGACIDVHVLQSSAKTAAEIQTDDVVTMNMFREPLYILKCMAGREALFAECLRWTKSRARAMGIYDQMYGYLGGISCAILVAHCLRASPDCTSVAQFSDALVRHYSQWNWEEPITLQSDRAYRRTTDPCDQFMVIALSTAPFTNTARRLVPSTAACWKRALAEGFAHDLPALPYQLRMTLQCTPRCELEKFQRLLARDLHRVVLALEQRAGETRPGCEWTVVDNRATYVMQMLRTSSVIDREMQALQTKLAGLSFECSVELTYSVDKCSP
eukprot:TRINITY_DN5301_c0_g1_i1.p1 TRINITY_DN5301_c0_g1~~TRINITY_DN5301_c0_g1_i1.p1  ORF type:complete len:898 (-),score=201.09 TRINITY_DN5301_c0_g1_i1:68-2761(-)